MKTRNTDGATGAKRGSAREIQPSPTLRKLAKIVDAKQTAVAKLEERRDELERDLHAAEVEAAKAQIKAGYGLDSRGESIAETAEMKSLKKQIAQIGPRIEAARKQLSSASKLANNALLKDAGNSDANLRSLMAQLDLLPKAVPQNSELMNKALKLIEELKASGS